MTDALDARSADALCAAFRNIAAGAADDPLVNPVRTLASRLFLGLESGAVAAGDLAGAVAELERAGFEARAAAFHKRRRGDPGPDAAFAALEKKDFDAFRAAIEATPVGVVFTAHPTFALTGARRDLIAAYAEADRDEWRRRLSQTAPGAPPDITLDDEHDDVLSAIERAKDAAATLNSRIIDIARTRFPDRWRALRPAPVSIASWVGYDLDGRTDIHWGQSITIRLKEKALQLDRYVAALDGLPKAGRTGALKALRDELAAAAKATWGHAQNFSGDLSDPDIVVAAANALTADKDARLVSLQLAIKTVSQAIDGADDETATALMLLRAEMQSCGLGAARIHLRVNAAQVRSALRSDLGLDPDQDFKGRTALNVASAKAQETKARAVNFGSLFLEQMTARRQFMMCAQILKHIDADTPIRFLIAECEAPATVMGAVYLARAYGVEDKLDISPLFETPEALEGGGRFIERLLAEPEYRAYVKRRGRMAIQIGYSDSGRFMGQATASLASERLQVLFARALGKAGLPDVEALVFNTHGESMGRGAFPGGYRARMDHLSTPWVRSRFRHENLAHVAEFSFQGGEGYLHFQTPELAANAIETLWSLAAEAPPPDFSDRYYQDINYSWDVYRALKAWQEALYQYPDYRDVIFAFPQNLLYKTGSRKVKRPSGAAAPPEIRMIRAIPHNAILQQIGAPVNVSGGIGAASGREPDRFIEHVAQSPRMRDLLNMTETARRLTSVSILRAYAGLYAPSYWSALAGMARRTERAEVYETVTQMLQDENVAPAFAGLADFIARDLRAYDGVRDATAKEARKEGVNPELGVLHAARQALIARAASLVARMPSFSRRHDVDRNDLIELALNLELAEAAAIIRRIFPKESPAADLMANLNEAVESDEAHGGAYPEIHATIIEPLEETARILALISPAIANYYGAYG